jgi:hypothetical protein
MCNTSLVDIGTYWRPRPGEDQPALIQLQDGRYALTPFRARITDVDWHGAIAVLLVDIVSDAPVVREIELAGQTAVTAWPPVKVTRLARAAMAAYLEAQAIESGTDENGEEGLIFRGVSRRHARDLTSRRRAHTVLSDDYLRQVAGVYLEAAPTGHPTRAVRERWHLSPNTAPKHVAAARGRIDPATGKPFLPPPGDRR